MSEELQTIVEYSEDIADAEAPEPIPVGPYPANIESACVKDSKTNPDRQYYEVGFTISVDDYPADYDARNAPEGTRLFFRRLSAEDMPGPRYRVRKFCEAIGAQMPKRQVDASEWIGLTATVEIEHEDWEGMPRAQITKVSEAVA